MTTFTDPQGRKIQTPDQKPPADGTEVRILDGNGGYKPGVFTGGGVQETNEQ
jgi:hypothetical protein